MHGSSESTKRLAICKKWSLKIAPKRETGNLSRILIQLHRELAQPCRPFRFLHPQEDAQRRNFKSEYYKYVEALIEELPQEFGDDSIYENVIYLCKRWKIELPVGGSRLPPHSA